ncbi:MAG: efflux RND transporter periplasmic adaptor subunit [bacterium]|nr:efflux RND transporter periplasmic adaptor subunit [bacterium]
MTMSKMNSTKILISLLLIACAVIFSAPGEAEHVHSAACGSQKAAAAEVDEHKGHDHAAEEADHDDGEDDHEGHDHVAEEVGQDDDDDHEGEEGLLHLSRAERANIGLEVVSAGPATIGNHINLPGEIELNADRVAHIVPGVGGIVRDVHKRLGDKVKAGELMAILDCRELAEAKAVYLEAHGNLELARSNFEREKNLQGKGISSDQEFLDARQAQTSASIALRSAEQQLLAMGETKDRLGRMLKEDNTSFAEYRLNAPIDGTIIEKHITLGEALDGGDEVFVLADLSSVWVRIGIYQKDLPRIAKGQSVRLFDGAGHVLADGEIDFISPILGERTRAATARVTLSNPNGNLNPGSFVTAAVETDIVDVPVAVEAEAVQMLDGETVLFVVEGDGFEPRPVITGSGDGKLIEILGGLESGEHYVAHGAFELKAKMLTSNMDPHAGHGH